MLFDQLCVFFQSVVVACYSISRVSFFDQGTPQCRENVAPPRRKECPDKYELLKPHLSSVSFSLLVNVEYVVP